MNAGASSFDVRAALEVIRALPDGCRVGITGTQQGLNSVQYYWAGFVVELLWRKMWELHEGHCIGADEDVTRIVRRRRGDREGPKIYGHPSNMPDRTSVLEVDVMYPPLPPLERNHVIVDVSHILVALPHEREERLRSGTWATVRYARQQNRPIIYIYP